jgi:hypothetical protein
MSERAFRSSKAADAAVVLPVFGVFLLMPPLISLFAAPAAILGVPLIVLYLFAVWGGLIACAALLARRLNPAAAQPQAETAAGTPPA